ncbi:MAG: DUF3098 domain-containing protein [Bacteroidaceae bacterium]|nr:DUF3098 domain-containing protein [Bacteroidaceae bacterium]
MKKQTSSIPKTHAKHTWRCAFAWQNFALAAVAVAFIVTGFLLMLPETDVRNRPGGRFAPAPGPGAFDARRIRVAPVPCFIGFAMMPLVIMYVPRERKKSIAEKII